MTRRHNHNLLAALQFLAIPVSFLLVMSIWPLVYSVWVSLYRFNLFTPDNTRFTGLGNFAAILQDEVFWHSLTVTAEITAVAIALQLVIGLIMAVLVDRHPIGGGVLRTLLIAPILMSPILVGLMWRYMYEPEIGVINYFLRAVGIKPVLWISQATPALWAIVIVSIWQWTPFFFLVLLAGIKNIAPEVDEAAQLDGCTLPQRLYYVVLPLLKPLVMVVLLFRLIDTLKDFALVYIMTFGGPGRATYMLSFYAWMQGFNNYEMGYASAVAIVIVILINIVVALVLRYFRAQLQEG